MTDTIRPRMFLFAVVLVVLVIGVLAGGLSVRSLNAPGHQELSQFLEQLLRSLTVEGTAPGSGWQWMAAQDVLKTAGLLWLLGLSVIGVPLIAAVVFLRGFVLGFTLGFLIDDLLLRGAALGLVALLPQNLVLIPGLLFCAVGAIAFSLELARTVFGRSRGITIYHHLRREGGLGLLGCTLLFIGSLVESFVSPTLTAVAARYLLRGV
jgi:stage II sporulation protein M